MKARVFTMVRMITETVGSFVSNHGIMASNAITNTITSDFVMSLLPFVIEMMAINMVRIPVTPVVHEPAPAPFCHWPRKAKNVTSAQTTHVKIWGFVLLRNISMIYGTRPMNARATVIRPMNSFIV